MFRSISDKSAGAMPAMAAQSAKRVPVKNFCRFAAGFAVPFLLAANLWAAHGIVQTTDGKTFEGDIRLEDGAFVVGDTQAKIELQKLALMRIQPPTQPAETPSLVPTQGLRGIYFTNQNLTGRGVIRIDPAIDFDWQEGSPTNGIGPDHFSVRWEGQIKAPASESFMFLVQADDGARLWVNNQLLVDKWQPAGAGEWSGSINLEAGKKYSLMMQYFDQSGVALAKLFWSSPSTPRSIIPAEHLSPPPAPATNAPATNAAAAPPKNGLLGLYFNDSDLSGEFKVRYDPSVEFDASDSPPMGGMNANRFSVRWSGRLVPQFSQHYTFYTLTDDGVRLWLDNKLIIDSWREESINQTSVPIGLVAGAKYDIRMEAFHIGPRWMARLSWSSPSIPMSPIPSLQLFPGPAPDAATLAAAKQKTPVSVVLAGGSVIARKIHSADDTAIRFSESAKEPVLSTVHVARIILQPLSAEIEARLQPGRMGLLLNSKDFIDGEFRGLSNGRIKFSSVLFGIKSYDLNQVLAIVLRDLKPAPARFEIRTRDESLLLANDVRLEKDQVAFQDALLAGLKVPAGDLLEIKIRQ
jgi:PA14 domain